MNEFLEGLYDRFLLRDVIGKAVPGFILLFIICNSSFDVGHFLFQQNIFIGILVFALSFVAGIIIQWFGVQVGAIRIYVWEPTKARPTRQEASLHAYHIFLTRTRNNHFVRIHRERFVVLKHIAGNFASLGILVIILRFISLLWTNADQQVLDYILVVSLAVIVFILWRESHHFADEQRIWEELNQ